MISTEGVRGLPGDIAVNHDGDALVAEIAPTWDLVTPNGGYLGALCMSAAASATTDRVPSSIACAFLAAPRSGRLARFDVAVLRSTKRADAVSVDLRQDERLITRATVWMRSERGEPGLEHEAASMPSYPPPSDVPIVDAAGSPRKAFPFWANLEERRLPVTGAAAEWTAWYRFLPQARFGEAVADDARTLMLLDVLALPACVAGHPSQFAHATTLQTDVAFSGSPEARETEWILIHVAAPVSRDGFLHAYGTAWSERGDLLAYGHTTMMYIGPVLDR